ncbi:hypothetical protein [Streptomyces sp. NPDC005096]|uniref:hypothetical protein n=1 Tax=Streptomyces sp. NPDC005096 TaxID=3154559 RepID=UPI0033B739C2
MAVVSGHPQRRGSALRLLFYGNFLPLHGSKTIVRALAIAAHRCDLELAMSGNRKMRDGVEELVREESPEKMPIVSAYPRNAS